MKTYLTYRFNAWDEDEGFVPLATFSTFELAVAFWEERYPRKILTWNDETDWSETYWVASLEEEDPNLLCINMLEIDRHVI